LKVEEDGTLLTGGRDDGCFVGEAGLEVGRCNVPATNGGFDFWGLVEGAVRLIARGCAERQVKSAGGTWLERLTVVGSLLLVSKRVLW
jgi:hypothetical protein